MIIRIISVLLLITSFSVIADNLLVTDAWIQNLPPVVPVRAGYMKLSNKGKDDLKIVSIKSEKFSLIEIHTSIEINGMISMQPVEILPIKAGETLHLEPGGLHLMMMNPLQSMLPGDQTAVTLIFDDESTKIILMEVRK